MTSQSIRFPTLANEIWPDFLDHRSWARYIFLAVVGAILLTLSAKVKVPFYPVPITMQSFVVLALGLTYGARLGASAVLVYLAVGALGLPVFAGTPEKGIGLAYMMGPTGGYLLGFIIAAATTGYLAERGWDRKALLTFSAMLIGNIVIYIPGLLWLANIAGWDKPILQWGLIPFLPGDLVKIVLAMIVIPATWKLLRKPD